MTTTALNDAFNYSIYTHGDVAECAHTLHLLAWASAYEEEGGNFSPGTRIEDVAPPTTKAALALAHAVVKAADDSGIAIDANDLAHNAVGSGGGSGNDYRYFSGLWRGEFAYYVGDDGKVYAFVSPAPQGQGRPVDAPHEAVAEDAESFGLHEQVQIICTVTYDITDPDAADTDNDGVIERGFIVGGSDLPCGEEGGVPLVGAAARKWQQENGVERTLRLPYDADELRELARGRSVTGIVELEADSVQDQHTGAWRHETLHVKAAESKTTLSASRERAITDAVRKALRIR